MNDPTAADLNGSPPPATNLDKPNTKEKPHTAEDPELRHIVLALNPLGILIGHYSIQGEYLVARHHAVTLNPFFAHVPMNAEANGQEVDLGSLTGFGGELGYRFYTGKSGAEGFYVGPSFLFATYSQSGGLAKPTGSQSSDSFLGYGGALDIGGQAIVGPGIVIGGGFGLQYTATSEDINTDNLNLASAIVAGGGLRPRFLLSAGYSF